MTVTFSPLSLIKNVPTAGLKSKANPAPYEQAGYTSSASSLSGGIPASYIRFGGPSKAAASTGVTFTNEKGEEYAAADILEFLIENAKACDGKEGRVGVWKPDKALPSEYLSVLYEKMGFTNLFKLTEMMKFFIAQNCFVAEEPSAEGPKEYFKLKKTAQADKLLAAWKGGAKPVKPVEEMKIQPVEEETETDTTDTTGEGNASIGKPIPKTKPQPNIKPVKPVNVPNADLEVDPRLVEAEISDYVVDMLAEAKAGLYDNLVTPEEQLRLVLNAMKKVNIKHTMIVGEPTIGKSAIMKSLAVAIKNKAAGELNDSAIWQVDPSLPGMDEVIPKLLGLARDNPDVMLYFEEGFPFVAPAGQGPSPLSTLLRPVVKNKKARMVIESGHTTGLQVLKTNPGWETRFNMVELKEPSPELTMEMIKKNLHEYEEKHQTKYPEEVLNEAIRLCKTYLPSFRFPAKALDVIDEAGVLANNEGLAEVTNQHIAQVVSKKSGIPLGSLQEDEREKLLRLEEILHKRVFSQDEAIRKVADVIRLRRSGITSTNDGPMATFIFVGPTGVGKTETAKALAEWMTGKESDMTRIDMTEYMEPHTVAKLIGSPPGYVGYEDGGQLTEAIRKKPFGVILLDEFEKAHPDVYKVLLPLFDEGRLTDSHGITVDASNCVIIMTSNVAAAEVQELLSKSQTTDEQIDPTVQAKIDTLIEKGLKRIMTPEQLNRIDDVVKFQPLTKAVQEQIVHYQLNKLLKDVMKTKGIEVRMDDGSITFLMSKLFSKKSEIHDRQGGRKGKDVIKTQVKIPLANFIIQQNSKKGDKLLGEWDMTSDSIVFAKVEKFPVKEADAKAEAEAPKEKKEKKPKSAEQTA